MAPPKLFGQLLATLGLVTDQQISEALERQARTGERLGEALVRLGYVTRPQLQHALLQALGLEEEGAAGRPQLGEILVGLKFVSESTLQAALVEHQQSGRHLGEILVDSGACSYRQLYEALELQRKMEPAPVAPVRAAPSKRHRVMVIDDSALTCEYLRQGLGPHGYDVETYTDPRAAADHAEANPPSAILCDLQMPELDGIQLCRRLKQSRAQSVPVILLTARDGDSERVAGLRAGADDFVGKTASMDEIHARIETVIRRSSEAERIRSLFARYAPEAVVEQILAQGDVVLTGEQRDITILFADIRNFTQLADSLPPAEVVHVLNAVLGRLSDAVLTVGGTLDKYLGDGLMAFFGAPVAYADEALRAVQSARMMMKAMGELNVQLAAERKAEGKAPLPLLELGVGINSGPVIAGNIGSQMRTEYTCIGDAANVAARLCSIAQGGEVLLGTSTAQRVGVPLLFDPPVAVRLKGKPHPVDVVRFRWNAA
jgi:adenylate cyclase